MFIVYISILLSISLVGIGYGAWTDSNYIFGEIKTSGLNVEIAECDAKVYSTDEKKKEISISLNEVKQGTINKFCLKVVNKSVIPVVGDFVRDDLKDSNNFIKYLTLKEELPNENKNNILCQYDKPESELKNSDSGTINFKISIGKEIPNGSYNCDQKLVFKQNEKNYWKDELNIKININVVSDQVLIPTATPSITPHELHGSDIKKEDKHNDINKKIEDNIIDNKIGNLTKRE